MARFPANDIMSLTDSTPRYDLAESVGPDLRLGDLADLAELADLPLAYGTPAGDPRLRRVIADAHGTDPARVAHQRLAQDLGGPNRCRDQAH